ncbi:MAG TPA: nucleotide exchange factor GrpE [bacterium]|nr:nucleotide exchange factor GrpE [bacterium]
MEEKDIAKEGNPESGGEVTDAARAEEKNEEELALLCRKQGEELKEQKDRLLRLAAQFDNYRKRAEKEKVEIFEEGERYLVQEFLPLLDNLDRAEKALEKGDDSGAVKEGVELILEKFRRILQKLEIESVESGTFDPAFHHAVEIREGEEYEDNRIVETLQKGFVHKGKLIRPAIVVVGKKKEKTSEKNEEDGKLEDEE